MTEGIWVALISAVATIIVALIEHYRRKNGSNPKVAILRPYDGQEIVLAANETKLPISRTIAGKVSGFTKEQIIASSLEVVIDVKTDKWYSQGKAKVQSDGTWSLADVRLGGLVHTIRATLQDPHQVYGKTEIEVIVPSVK